MFGRIRAKFYALKNRFNCVPRGYYTVAILLIIAAAAIRFTTGGTHMIYNVLQGRGVFPGPFAYSLLYLARIILSGIVLTFVLYANAAYNEHSRGVIASVLAVILILLEYRLIFGGVSIVLAVIFSIITPLLALYAVAVTRIKNKFVSIAAIFLIALQCLAVVQLVSLAVCV